MSDFLDWVAVRSLTVKRFDGKSRLIAIEWGLTECRKIVRRRRPSSVPRF